MRACASLPTRLAITPTTWMSSRKRARPVASAPKVCAIAEASITAITGRPKVAARSALLGLPSNRPITPSTSTRSDSRDACASNSRQCASPPMKRSSW